MRDLAQVDALTESEQLRFQQLVRHLLGGRCFVRKPKASSDEDWRFLLRYRAIFEAYFAAAGWEFEVREDLGAALARPTLRRHAHLFSVLQTHMVYQLLHAHFEATAGTDLDRGDAQLAFGELLERLESTLPPGVKLQRASLEKAAKKLRDFGAVSLSKGFSGDANDVVTIHPVMEMVVPRAVIERQIHAVISPEPVAREVPGPQPGEMVEHIDALMEASDA